MDKAKRKEILNQLAEKSLAEFRKELPFDENLFPTLFDFIDEELGKENCQSDFQMAMRFCQENNISESPLLEWLHKQGVFCDCEILNLEDSFQYLTPPIIPQVNKQNERLQKLSSLKIDEGFSIEKIPTPWTLFEKTGYGSVIHTFKFGKSNNCIIDIEYDFPSDFFENDAFWINLWANETGLNYSIQEMIVERQIFENFAFITVKTKEWIPVLTWIKCIQTDKWYLKMRTELARYKGDIKELTKLLQSIIVSL